MIENYSIVIISIHTKDERELKFNLEDKKEQRNLLYPKYDTVSLPTSYLPYTYINKVQYIRYNYIYSTYY